MVRDLVALGWYGLDWKTDRHTPPPAWMLNAWLDIAVAGGTEGAL